MIRRHSEIVELPKILDSRGNLSFIEEFRHIHFKVSRCYWIYDVPGGEKRGGHAFRRNEEFIVALSGSFDVILDNGIEKSVHHLNRSYYGLYIPVMCWREIENFSTNSVAFVMASEFYKEMDYIRNYEIFRREVAG